MSKSFKAFNSAFIGAAQAAATELHERASVARAAYEQSPDDKLKRQIQRNECHEKKALALAELGEAELKVLHDAGIDANNLLQGTREYAKHVIAALKGLTSNSKPKSNPLDAALAYIVAKNSGDLSRRIVQREAGHDTDTQGGYIHRMFKRMGAVTAESKIGKDHQFTVDTAHPIVAKLLAIYAPATSS